MTKDRLSEVIALWDIQENLLQQYRTIFITKQSILVAVAASVFTPKDPPWVPMLMLFTLAMFSLWLWLDICNRRGKAVYACQYMARMIEDGDLVEKPVEMLKNMEDSKFMDPKIANDQRYRILLMNRTRVLMQYILPTVFVLAWIVLWIHVLRSNWDLVFIPRGTS